MNWAASPEGYDIGPVADAALNGDGGFHTSSDLLVVNDKSFASRIFCFAV